MALMLDSNIIIYSLLPGHEKLREFIATNLSAFSAISYVEVLGFHGITAVDRDSFVQLFDGLELLEIDRPTLERAVSLRQQRKMSVGDSIIAATALVRDRVLLTRNIEDFRWVAGLRLENPMDSPAAPGSPPQA